MPGPDNINDEMIRKLIEEFDKDIGKKMTDIITGEVIVPKRYEMEEERRKYERDIFKEWDKVNKTADPVNRLRKEMHEELNQIKAAIRKIGILLDGDAPTEEQMEKFKMLKEAYTKYKMIEALVLGKEKD